MIKKRATTAVTREDLKGKNLESYKVVEAEERLERKIKPRLDYSDPANFATYGSAEEYYVASVDNIQDMYPYDGSKHEKTEWHVSASGLDNYLFDNRYPRRNGHISISHDGWGTPSLTTGSYSLPDTVEYITLFGGPHTDTTAQSLSSLFPSDGGTANVWSPTEDREANLTIGTSNTIEWWMKKDAFESPGQQEVVFDLWNNGRMREQVELFSGLAAYLRPLHYDSASNKLYWRNHLTGIYRATPNIGETPELVVAWSSGAGFSLDPEQDYIYFTTGTGLLYRTSMSIAGSPTNLITSGLGGGVNLSAYDASADKFYWTDDSAGKIFRITPTPGTPIGSEEEVVTGLDNLDGIALDTASGKIYWTEGGTSNKICRANLADGSAAEDLVTGLDTPKQLALDIAAGKMYWADDGTEKVQCANMDGSGDVEDIVVTDDHPDCVALDTENSQLFYGDWDFPATSTSRIHRLNIGELHYGRFAILANNSTNPLHLTYVSGSTDTVVGINATFSGSSAPTDTSLTDGKWHHYAVSVNAAQGIANLYVDGEYRDTVTGAPTGEVTGDMSANIGSYYEPRAADDIAVSFTGSLVPGWCKLSASLDEFRFWKTARTAEDIGLNWNTQVFGGTNTDTANTDLGVYYKFNEGIMGTSQDATVLDYSGRISNGAWTGYASGARSLTSAMVESGAATEEFEDPIVYATNPDVMSLRENLRLEGLYYDQQNNASLYNSIPSYIREEDGAQQNLLKLTQIMSSYLDSLQASIGELSSMKDVSYPSGSESAFPFVQRNLQNLGFSSEDFFIDATVLEKFMHKNNTGELEYKLSEIKNLIYQNIYNNLAFIAESKGTEKSFRNLARCFGVDDRLLKLNIYSNNEEYKLEDKYNDVVINTNTIDFSDTSTFEATMFQTSSGETPSSSFLTGSSVLNPSRDLNGITLEADIIFPQKPPKTSPFYFDTPFVKSSLFGFRYTTGEDDFDWTPASPDISVYAIKEDRNSKNAYFELSSSYLDVVLTSSVFEDAYNDERWNFAVKVKNTSHLTGSSGSYTMEFQGANSDGDRIDNSFSLSHEFTSSAEILSTITSGKRVYAGALRTDTTGSVVEKADTRISAVRYWGKYLTEDTILNHAKDATSYGVKDANRPLFGSNNDMPAIDTLQLYWGFDSVTTSSATGEFDILDLSSGSADKAALYGDYGDFHPGKGYGFPADTTVMNREYVNTLVRVNPENSNGADMVKVLTQAEEIKQELSNPTNLVFSIEKSLYQEISDEMLKFFSTSADLASLYMKPTDKYNTSNHELAQMRSVFFDRMENSPDVNKFYEYFKWIDDAVVTMLRQQLPASAATMDGSINIIESHILERNKVLYKTPTYAASKSPIYEGSISTPNTERTD